MKQYYKTLQVSRNASLDEIKEQYRKLAREHHPDRFKEGEGKQVAEERFIEINEAYNGLKKAFQPSVESAYVDPNQPPTPIPSQTLLDFGTMVCGTRKTITFIVQNDGGPVESVRFDYDKGRGWLKVEEKAEESEDETKFPLKVDVTIDTEKMDPQLAYQDKIDIWLNDQMARVTLVAGVKPKPLFITHLLNMSPQFAALILFLVATVSGIFAMASVHDGPLIFANESSVSTQEPAAEVQSIIAESIIAEPIVDQSLESQSIEYSEPMGHNQPVGDDSGLAKAPAIAQDVAIAPSVAQQNNIVEQDVAELVITEQNVIEPASNIVLSETGQPLIFANGIAQKTLYIMPDLFDESYSLKLNGYSPIWSPVGQQVAFLQDTADGTQIFLTDISITKALVDADAPIDLNELAINVGGSTDESPQRISRSSIGESDARSSDTSQLFAASKPEQLTSSEDVQSGIAWSPDGQQIAFRAQFVDEKGNSFEILKAVDVATKKLSLLSIPAQGSVSHFVWANDGETIFATFHVDGSEKVHMVDVASGLAEPFVQFESRDAAWSPDGNHVAIASKQGLYLLDKKKESVRRLSTFSNWEPVWSPSGSAVAFLGVDDSETIRALPNAIASSKQDEVNKRDEANLWLLDVETEDFTQLTTAGAIDFTWGTTEDRLLYTATGGDMSDTGLYMWSLELGEEAQVVAEVSDPQIAWASASQ